MRFVKQTQHGFSLVITLLFIGVLTGVLTGISSLKKGETIKNEARISGIEGTKVARAARIYVRDQMAVNANLVNDLFSASQEVSVGDLISLSLLPNNFGRQNGGNYFNALGQRIRVYMANHPVGGDPSLPTTVPTAYVIFEDNDKSTPTLVQLIVESMRKQSTSVAAPLYDGTTNLTGICDGNGQTVGLWDSGCMGENDYTTLTGNAFVPGGFVIPAWRSVDFDARAVTRFPQPERPFLHTMLVDLEMAEMEDCDVNDDGVLDQNQITFPTEAGTDVSELCSAQSDNAGSLFDNRRSIENIGNMAGEDLVINPQTGDSVFTDDFGAQSVVLDQTNALIIQGDLNATSDARVFGGAVSVGNELIADRNIFVSGRPTDTIPASANISNLNTGTGTMTRVIVQNRPAVDDINSVSVREEITNVADINTGQLVTNNLVATADGQTITVNNRANIIGVVSANDVTANSSRIPGVDYGFISGQVVTGDQGGTIGGGLSVSGSMNIENNLNILSEINVTNAGGTALCTGDCPKRELLAQCQQLVSLGVYPDVETCMEALD